DVRLHRVRGRDRGVPERRRVLAGSAREAALMRSPMVARALLIALFLIVWEVAARGFVDKMFLAPPSRVLASLGEVLRTPGVTEALKLTLWELVAAFALSVALGVAIGLAVGLRPFPRRSFLPIVLLL